ncbi:MAG: alpha-E domain-containing protein [Bermanella sp.]
MLSRVASNIYWLGRYLERAENTARIMNVNSNLLLDLPKDIRLGWEPILEILTSNDDFKSKYNGATEANIASFIIADKNNPSSIISSLYHARENARTIREIIPREAWEQINSLYLLAKDGEANALNRRHRYSYLNKIILNNQTITGILAGTMTHDEGYDFLRLGRNLERADMTTRIIDVRSASLLPDIEDRQSPFENIQWMSVLKSLTGYQMYRREVRLRIKRQDVLRFLFLNPKFPRALNHTLQQVKECLDDLPNGQEVITTLNSLKNMLESSKPEMLDQDALHTFIDDIQLGLSKVHDKTSSTYF